MKHANAEQATARSPVSQQQPANVLGSGHDANMSGGRSCDFGPQSHDNQMFPGLPPLPELPFPPTHSTPVQYSSAIAGSEDVLHSEVVPGKCTSASQPCERLSANVKTPAPLMAETQAEPKKDSVLFNPAGLSWSERISEYLATAETKAGGKRTSQCQPTPVPSSSGITGLYAAHVAPHSRVTGSPCTATAHPVMGSAVHKATCGSSAETTGTRTWSPAPPLVVVSGCWNQYSLVHTRAHRARAT